jgi:alkylation response protein AidB-like acyl-CoA dehydrogenase
VAAIAASARALADGGNDTLADGLLPKLVSGECVVISVLPEASGRADGVPAFSAAASSGGGLRLNGAAKFVPSAESADGFIVPAAMREGTVLVHLRRDGVVRPGGRRTVDGGGWSGIAAENLDVAAGDIVAGPNAGAATLETMRRYLLIGLAAEMLGVMEQALDLALGYLKTRVQFNRPIGSFQALQHRAVNDYMEVELTRSLLYQVCAAVDAGRGTPAMVAAVKSRASEAVVSVTKSVIQMHGAIGFTDEYDAGLYLRRAMALSVQYGDAATHRRRFAELAAG